MKKLSILCLAILAFCLACGFKMPAQPSLENMDTWLTDNWNCIVDIAFYLEDGTNAYGDPMDEVWLDLQIQQFKTNAGQVAQYDALIQGLDDNSNPVVVPALKREWDLYKLELSRLCSAVDKKMISVIGQTDRELGVFETDGDLLSNSLEALGYKPEVVLPNNVPADVYAQALMN